MPRTSRIASGSRVAVVLAATSLLPAVACSAAAGEQETPTTPASADPIPVEDQSLAYFAGGCFWGVEYYMEQVDGVIAVESGYMGGHLDNPSYDDVSSKTSGHVETVRVRYDASRVDYETLAQRFFEIHDPTQHDGQGPDVGAQYLSMVFYGDAGEKATNEKLIAQLRERGYDVATKLEPATRFWPAEDYHQDYYARSGKKPYCHARVRRFDD